jgi:hypothetical protein
MKRENSFFKFYDSLITGATRKFKLIEPCKFASIEYQLIRFREKCNIEQLYYPELRLPSSGRANELYALRALQ